MGLKVNFKWMNIDGTFNRILKNDRVGWFVASSCAKRMDKFVPMDTGMLSMNYTVEPFQVTYRSLYAHYQYTGKGFHFSRDRHPLATSYWNKAMTSADLNTIASEVSEYIKRL